MACNPMNQIDQQLLMDSTPTCDLSSSTGRNRPEPVLVAANEDNGEVQNGSGAMGCGQNSMLASVAAEEILDGNSRVGRSSLSQVDIMPEQELSNTYERFRFIKMHTYKRKVAGRGLQAEAEAETPITGVIGEELKAIFPDAVMTNRAHLVGTPEPEESIHVNQYALLYKTIIVAQQLQTRSDNQAEAIEALAKTVRMQATEIADLKAQRSLR
ncbi:unnamed protein product [Vitrella brassicaformis CCMP3155]|uniref:Peptidase S74 domain-containing protein n=1 Tax=Vitrella brassicaformis (strain CCMP3155) TaxID=1169540 RepID=A0A0G4ENW0_VITBC|nr:unnamed protein product [Vitrella brassicaformis CCMP3155]|eukprot:CEL99308.1 unnamed protein product [Vitrella brassicaformis CCMP3155]